MENSNLKKCNVPFGIVPNELLNNHAISMKAKGLFAFMQSKPEGWEFSVKLISGQTRDGIDSVSEGLKELELFGFLERKKVQTGNGFSTTYYLYFESLLGGNSNTVFSNLGKSNLGKSNLGKSLNNSNKELSKKDISKKEERDGSLAFSKEIISSDYKISKQDLRALEFLEVNFPSDFERLMMQYKSKIKDFVKFSEMFEATVLQEGLEFKRNVIEGRFIKYARNWTDNQNKYEPQVIELNPNARKEKISGI